MPTPRQYASPAERQAAYRARCAHARATPPSAPPLPGYRRWEVVLTQVRGLLGQVADEMAAYAEARSDAWQASERGEWFTERLEVIEEVRVSLHDLPPPPR